MAIPRSYALDRPEDSPALQRVKERALAEKANNVLIPGKFVYQTVMDFSSHSLSAESVLANVRAAIAFDLGVERSLIYFPDPNVAGLKDKGVDKRLGQRWKNLVSHGGFYMDKPENFELVERTPNTELRTSLSGKEQIVNNAFVLSKALRNKHDVFNVRTFRGFTPGGIQTLVAGGLTTKSLHDKHWNYFFIQDSPSGTLIKQAQLILQQNFALGPSEFVVSDVGEGLAVIAVDMQSFEHAFRGWHATEELVHAIRHEVPISDISAFIRERISAGADPKYMGTNVAKNPTFRELMNQCGRHDMADVLFEIQGSSEIPFAATNPHLN